MTQDEQAPPTPTKERHAVSVEWDAKGGCEWSCSCRMGGDDYRQAVAAAQEQPAEKPKDSGDDGQA